jgi:multidrug efflux system outer membrane protein
MAAGSVVSLAQWWQRFDDPALSALVMQALLVNTDVRTAQAALQQSRALRDGKLANLGPTLKGSASVQRNQTDSNDATNSFQAGFDASWEPDVFGGQRSTLNAAQADAQAAEASLANVQVSLAAEVAVTYIELRGLQSRLAIARNSLAAQSETLQITRWRAQAGLVSSLDVEQAVAASEQTSAQIPSLITSVTQNLNSLAVLTGQAPGALQGTLGVITSPPAQVPQAPGDLVLAIPAQTLRQRPDVRVAEYRISAALSRVAQADAARYPGFQISGSLGLRALTLGTLSSGASIANALLASVSVPLFDGGAARAQVRAQEAALEQARVGYQATVLTALKDVEDALIALQGDRERLARLQSATVAAANADLLARQRYSSGLIDFRTILETQRTLLSAQDSVEITRASLSADHVRLYKALGGGWIPDTQTSAP